MNGGTLVLNRYQLHEQVGAGGTGVVWKATDQRLHQTVALKRISFPEGASATAQLIRDRALREARLTATLKCAHRPRRHRQTHRFRHLPSH